MLPPRNRVSIDSVTTTVYTGQFRVKFLAKASDFSLLQECSNTQS
jgi:hypothetical protein